MRNLNSIFRRGRGAVGLQLALAMLFPAKSKGQTQKETGPGDDITSPGAHGAYTEAPPHLTGRWDFSRLFDVAAHPEIVKDAMRSARRAQTLAVNAVHYAARSSEKRPAIAGSAFVSKPMTHEEVRLWLQSFNAGPYACLKYRGDVPYEETQNYVPRVLKNYEQVKATPYDAHIQRCAVKYGLDPQMIRAIMKTESDFNKSCVSHAGARGLMQVMPAVWSEVMRKYDFGWEYAKGVFEPEKNIEVACAYLAWLRYDFLPRHFEAYERWPDAPSVLVRDTSRGVPDRATPRIIAKSAAGIGSAIAVADAGAPIMELKSPARAGVTIEDVANDSRVIKKDTANGKTRVVMKGGSGKKMILEVGKTAASSKVSVSDSADTDEKIIRKSKRPDIALNKSRKDGERQGG